MFYVLNVFFSHAIVEFGLVSNVIVTTRTRGGLSQLNSFALTPGL